VAGEGKKQRSNSERGKLRAPNLDGFYNRQAQKIEPGDYTFRTLLIRPEKPRPDRFLILDRALTDINWGDDGGSVLSGSMTVRRPHPDRITAVPVQRGHRIRLQLLWGGRWRPLWDMRVPEVPDVDRKSGTLSVQLSDDLSALKLNEKQWEFKKDKQHPKGWTADQITRAVCRDQRVRPGQIPQGKRKIKKLKLKGSGLEVIRKAWAMEKQRTLKRYIVRFREGRLSVIPFKRPGTLYVIKGIEKSASTSATGKGRPVTSIKATGRIKTGSKHKKVEEVVQSKPAMAKFGFSQQDRHYGRVDSRAELRDEAKRDLSEEIKVKRTANLLIPGIPFIEKGSTVKWITEEAGWHGKVGDTDQDRAIAFVVFARHTVLPTSYETEMELSQEDPYLADRERRDEERRDDKKKERKGRKPEPAAA